MAGRPRRRGHSEARSVPECHPDQAKTVAEIVFGLMKKVISQSPLESALVANVLVSSDMLLQNQPRGLVLDARLPVTTDFAGQTRFSIHGHATLCLELPNGIGRRLFVQLAQLHKDGLEKPSS